MVEKRWSKKYYQDELEPKSQGNTDEVEAVDTIDV
jgi:hypothetical protein